MKTILFIAAIILLVILLISASVKIKNESESKLSIFEHPSTFKKPDIEMVSKTSKTEDSKDAVHQYENKKDDKTIDE